MSVKPEKIILEEGETTMVARRDKRPEIREEDPRERAKKRAAQVREMKGDADDYEGGNDFWAPEAPAGWTYEWKRHLVAGQEDPTHMVELLRDGWEAVPTSRHPEMMPGQGNYPTIIRKGMILMERPTELVREAKEIDRRKAVMQVRAKEAQLSGTPEGTMTRDEAAVRPKIKKSYSTPIPEE
jgi:hypothetical protein